MFLEFKTSKRKFKCSQVAGAFCAHYDEAKGMATQKGGLMTTLQVQYLEHKERQRNNLAVEEETRRANMTREALSREANSINAGSLAESIRHNYNAEQLTRQKNAYDYDVGLQNVGVANRNADIAAINAGTNQRQADVAQQNANTNSRNADTRERELGETTTHNRVTEGINQQAANAQTSQANTAAERVKVANREADIAQQRADTEAIRLGIDTGLRMLEVIVPW